MSKIETLKFWAPWCKPCRVVSTQLDGLDITSHNIDDAESADLVTKFRVRNLPTLVFLKDGEEVYRHAGLITKLEYMQLLDKIANDN